MFRISLMLNICIIMVINCFASKLTDESDSLKMCQEIWYSCQTNADCCSGYCLKLSEWPEGACQPKGPNGCQELWYNHCKSNDECCTGYCFKQPHWAEGVCKTKKSKGVNGCQELWYNHCQSDKECCSKYCFKEPDWAEGVCKPRH